MRDITGNLITKSCYITYPVRKGSDMWMSFAKVIKCEENNCIIAESPRGRKIKIYAYDRVMKIEKDRNKYISKIFSE
jgi:hypothetical protein